MLSMVKKSNRKDRKDLRKAHKEKPYMSLNALYGLKNTQTLNAFQFLLWLQTSQTIKKKLK